MSKRKKAIKYTSRDFSSIKNDLIDYTKRYYPDTYKDFNEASFGSLMLDTVAYVGDILSFYLDYQANETFLDSALEYNNILRLGRQLGYNFTGSPTSFGTAVFYVLVPANTSGIGVDSDYIPILKRGSTVGSSDGIRFILNEDVDLRKDDVEIIVAQVDATSGLPTSYALKAEGQVISGELVSDFVTVGEYEPFYKTTLGDQNISEIISVTDSLGNEYFQVEHLSEDVIYKHIKNNNSDSEQTPFILKPLSVPRRFTVIQERGRTTLQFGLASEDEATEQSIKDPSEVALQVHGKDYTSDVYFDPSNLLSSDNFGISPSNTQLTIVYRINTNDNVNLAAGGLDTVRSPIFEFPAGIEGKELNSALISFVNDSIEVTNEEPFVGDISLIDVDPDTESMSASQWAIFAVVFSEHMCFFF